jgi:hypothetical protein
MGLEQVCVITDPKGYHEAIHKSYWENSSQPKPFVLLFAEGYSDKFKWSHSYTPNEIDSDEETSIPMEGYDDEPGEFGDDEPCEDLGEFEDDDPVGFNTNDEIIQEDVTSYGEEQYGSDQLVQNDYLIVSEIIDQCDPEYEDTNVVESIVESENQNEVETQIIESSVDTEDEDIEEHQLVQLDEDDEERVKESEDGYDTPDGIRHECRVQPRILLMGSREHLESLSSIPPSAMKSMSQMCQSLLNQYYSNDE